MHMKKKKKILVLLCSALFLTSIFPSGKYAYGEEAGYEEDISSETETEDPYPESYYWPVESNEISGWPQGPQIEAEAAVVMDADTGAFLYSKNMDAKEYPASITKIMTCLVAIENGNLDDEITFSEIVYDIEYASSHCGIKLGEKMTLRQALYALMLESANDAANGIAEYIAGSVNGFVDMMNARAAEIGCTNTHFVNPHGLHDDDHYTCAKDMALIAQEAFKNKTFRKIVGTVEYNIPPTNKTEETRYFVNHQKMMYQEDVYYEPCIGGKTGFTEQAYNTLVTYAKKDKRTLVSVILHVNGSTKSFLESAQILDYGYDNFKRAKVNLSNYGKTIGELAGADYLSEVGCTYDTALSTKTFNVKKSLTLDIPSSLKTKDLDRTIGTDGRLWFSYQGWNLGSTAVTVSSLKDLEIKEPEVSQTSAQTTAPSTSDVQETESSIKDKILNAGKELLQKLQPAVKEKATFLYEKEQTFEAWVTENDLAAAIIVFILILILVPVLVIAWGRNSRAKKIRRARKQEREERIRREEDIDVKSVSEIEQELREELAKEMENRKRKEEERELARRAEEELAEAEKIIEEKEALEEAEKKGE